MEYEELKKMAKWIMRKQGEKVSNYLSKYGQTWFFREVEVQSIKDQLQDIKDEITKQGIVGSEDRDRPKWNWVKSGNYNVKYAIRMLQAGNVILDQGLWIQVWDKHLIPKIAFFRWILAHEKLLTWDKLQQRGFIGPNRYTLCKKESETNIHIFVKSEFVRQCWQKLTQSLSEEWK